MRVQTPIRKKTKRIKTLRIPGILIDGAPGSEDERFVWREMGYEQLPTGEWYRPVVDRRYSPEIIRQYPHGHICKACRTSFRSKKYHGAYCPSCHAIIEQKQREIEQALESVGCLTTKPQKTVLEIVQEALRCPICEWQGNEGRHEPKNVALIREYLSGWVSAAHLHWMKHMFWNRFPYKSKFVRKTDWKQHQAEMKLADSLAEHFRKYPLIIEIPLQKDPAAESE